ncbi:MAK10-like protein [Tanacetum coccineum]
MQEYLASHAERIERFKKAIFKKRDEINGRMAEMFGLLKELTSSTTPKKVLVRDEIRNPITKNVNAISLYRIESEKVKENNEVIDKNITTHGKCSIEEPVRITNKEPLGEERKMIERPDLQPVSYYLKHKINKELIEGLVENQRFNDSLLAMQLVDMGGNFVIPCNIGGLKHMDALVDQGSDVNIMPLSTYNRLTDEKLVETDIRLSLASQSHIYPLGIAEDVLVEIASFVYPVDFVILDIKEDRKNPFILGTPFLTTAKAEIKFENGTITLKSGKSKANFHKCLDFFCKFKEREEDKVDPLSIVNERILEWEERIKFHREKDLEFNQWRNKLFNEKNSVSTNGGSKANNE